MKNKIKNTLIYKLLKSLKNNGIETTVKKIRYKILKTDERLINISHIEKKQKTKNIINNMSEIKEILRHNYINTPVKQPLISIIILTKDGLEHLERLFKSIDENTVYKNFELIVVDNNSKDKSIDFLEKNIYGYKLKIIKNDVNKSFSKANNEAVLESNGEYILFLNNDIEPLYGWLSHLVEIMQTKDNVGAVGSQLLYPYAKNDIFSTKVQHCGIAFKREHIQDLKFSFFKPYNIGMGMTPIVENITPNVGERIAITAACMLVEKSIFLEVAGFDEEYNYGYEDVDFCLKLNKKAYKNYYSQNSILFHYESSTQKQESSDNINLRRVHNSQYFKSKWEEYINSNYFFEKLNNNTGIFAQKKLKIAFVVTEAGENAVAGDYFTALELAEAFEKLGYEISFLTRRGGDNWYIVSEDVDILVSMLDSYDLNKIKNKSNNIITIAWIRNWPDRWLENTSFKLYDLVFASSQTLCNMISEKSDQNTILFPIATTPEKFIKKNNIDKSFKSDYSFTGNYWGVPREIETFLEPSEIKYKFSIYGKDWNLVKKFKEYHQGFLKYKNIPKVYANSKITIDDAVVGITKPYGSVNSRVFDAIAGSTLVVTNGVIGAKETFGDLLPIYETKEELHNFLEKYLGDDKLREEKIEELRTFVLSNHTYDKRALFMKQKIEEFLGIKKSFVIKMPIPKWNEAKTWGDYHLALGLKKQFEVLGHRCLLQILPEWDNEEGKLYDIVLVLRGLSKYKVKENQINFMWNISHPDKVSIEEYNSYDKIFVSSSIWANKLQSKVYVPVEVMHQCTDPDIFKPYKDKNFKHQLLFVGNSRKIFRKALKYLLPTKYDLAVYGTLWENIIDDRYIKGQHIHNTEVNKYYCNADIVLNDHWDSMSENGFISNRIFDVLACNGFILTDDINGLKDLFDDNIISYNSKEDFDEKVNYFLNNSDERTNMAKKGRNLVLRDHTYKNRVEQILNTIQ